MSAAFEPAGVPSALALPLGDDPVAVLEATVWAMAAVVSVQRQALAEPLEVVLTRDPQRTGVLESVGLVRRSAGGFVVHPALRPADATTARSGVEAKLSSLRQAVSAAASSSAAARGGWGAQADEVLLSQGQASAAAGRALAGKVVPRLSGCAELLAVGGSRILDVGTGVGALAQTLAESFPHAQVVGVDVRTVRPRPGTAPGRPKPPQRKAIRFCRA